MTQKEKLIEILSKRICRSADILDGRIDGVSYKEILADFLLENGVTVQPCEMFNKRRTMERDSNELLMRFSRKCKERDELARALDQTTVKLNDETARADALQRRCDDLEKSRQAWVMKCEEVAGCFDDLHEVYNSLRELATDYLRHYSDLYDHPWKNLWRHIKEALGIA